MAVAHDYEPMCCVRIDVEVCLIHCQKKAEHKGRHKGTQQIGETTITVRWWGDH
jgi:hypothetical protein